jgi:hypothetical protein
VPPLAGLSFGVVANVRGGEDIAFDSEGFLYGNDNRNVYRSRYGERPTLHAPTVGMGLRGADLVGADLFFADGASSGLVRVEPSGNARAFGSVPGINGLVAGPSRTVAVVSYRDCTVHLFEAATGRLISATAPVRNQQNCNGISWSPDHRTLYVNRDTDGSILARTLQPDFTLSDPKVIVMGLPGKLDGMASDECGNLYVIAVGGQLSRVNPATGGSESIGPPPLGGETRGIEFGRGGGWDPTSVYVSSQTFYALKVGVRGAPLPN